MMVGFRKISKKKVFDFLDDRKPLAECAAFAPPPVVPVFVPAPMPYWDEPLESHVYTGPLGRKPVEKTDEGVQKNHSSELKKTEI